MTKGEVRIGVDARFYTTKNGWREPTDTVPCECTPPSADVEGAGEPGHGGRGRCGKL